MTTTYAERGITYGDELVCLPRAGTLYDVMELILDRGMVIDVFVRVSLVGIEILKIDARIVVASVDTYLRFAEACNRLDLERDSRSTTVPELLGSPTGMLARAGARKATRSLGDRVRDVIGGGHREEAEEPEADEWEAGERRADERAGRPRPRPTARRTSRLREEEDRSGPRHRRGDPDDRHEPGGRRAPGARRGPGPRRASGVRRGVGGEGSER